MLSTLAYVANWTQVGEGRDYFATYESPALLEHTWSLAVEEQFYLIWPLALVAITWLVGQRRLRLAIGTVALLVASVSVGLATWLAHDGVQLNRLYYGTDTRAVGLALGAAAACVLARGEHTGERRIGAIETWGAVLGVAILAVLAVMIDGGERWLYGPGFLVIAVASLVVVTASSGSGPLRQALSWAPLVAIGRVSYGIYLWHWPVIVLLDEQRTGLRGPALGVLWVAATAALTVASWFLIEQRSPTPMLAHPWRTVGYVAAAVTIGVGASATVSAERASRGEIALPGASSDDVPSRSDIESPAGQPQSGAAAPDAAAAGVAAPGEPAPDGAAAGEPDGVLTDSRAADAPATDAGVPPSTDVAPAIPTDRPLRVLLIGDSVAVSLNPVPEEPITIPAFGDVEVRNGAVIACPVLRAGRWKFDGKMLDDPEVCERDDRFAEDVAAFQPDVVFMVFGWPGIGDGRYLDDGRVIFPCEAAFDVAWADEFELLAHRFTDVARVVVATVPPPGGPAESSSAGSECLNAELRERDVNLFDFADWICPAGDCTVFDSLRPDGVHFDAADDVRVPILSRMVTEALKTAGYRPTA